MTQFLVVLKTGISYWKNRDGSSGDEAGGTMIELLCCVLASGGYRLNTVFKLVNVMIFDTFH